MIRKAVQRVIKHVRKVNNRAFTVAVKRDSIHSICRRGTLHCVCEVSQA